MNDNIDFDSLQDNEPETNSVELIASGYDWVCPNCDEFNHEIEVTEQVTCKHCQHIYTVAEYYHAYN